MEEIHYDQHKQEWKSCKFRVGDRRVLLAEWTLKAYNILHKKYSDNIIKAFNVCYSKGSESWCSRRGGLENEDDVMTDTSFDSEPAFGYSDDEELDPILGADYDAADGFIGID
ncbi:hypothetical protein OIDMADRAFT_31480 [Oidiodendron maius Zn]|uniref:Uncharacterized protein n=1 Tax=Oidiodendron maius (strain Zn) TaxID=913774 RepID=A0A0C3CIB8_OIDMZ|nr:hypothetical protein OIDMADRAFT_31480 [Oidiodendron maius Zn]